MKLAAGNIVCIFILTCSALGQGAGTDSLRLRSSAGGAAWLLLPQSSTQQYRLLLPPSLGTSNHQLMWVNGTSGQISLLPPGSVGQILQMSAGGFSWVNPASLIVSTAWTLTGNNGTNPTLNFLGTTDNQPLSIRTNNIERLRISETGNVGIGTNSPSQRLHIVASTDPLRLEGLQIDNTLDQVVVATSNGIIRLRSASSLASSTAWLLTGNSGTNPATNFLGTTDNQPIIIRTNNTERLRITESGNVGIGTTSPGAKLSLGTDQANTKLAIYDGGSDQYGFGIQGSQFRIHLGNSGARFSFLNAPAGSEVMTIMGSGDVGIGTTTPNGRLHISGGDLRSDGHIIVRNTDNAARELRLYEPSGSGAEYTALRAQAQGNNIIYTLPSSLTPTSSVATGLLQTDAAGTLSWLDPQSFLANNAWLLSGNATGSAWNGTNGSFLGTTTTQPLVLATTNTTTRQPILFWAGNQQVLQLNPAGTTAPAWSIQRDAGGNTRGLYAVDLQVSRGSVSQVASGNNSVICGGSNNTASGVMSVIGGGEQNSAIGSTSTVSGGAYNVAQGGYSTVGGGYTNTAGSTGATVGGGTSNTAGGQYSTIGGGQSNTISPGEYSTISGGQNNTITGDYSAIAGGYNLRLGGRSFGFSGQSSTTQTNLSTNSNIAAFVDVDLWLYNRSNTARQLRFYVPTTDATGNAFYTAFRASSTQTGTITYTLPPSLTSTTNVANGYLQTDANGNLSWINPLTAVTTFAWSLTGNSATNPSTNFLGTTDNQPLVIRTNNVERLRVLSSGNVGIGTSTPLSALDIAGGIAIGTYAGSNAAPSNGLIVSGNAGIGIASPQVRLHVDGGTGNATYLKITNGTTSGTGSSSGFNVGLTTNASAELRLYNNSSMSFFTNNNEWIRLLNTGDLRVFGLAGTSGGHYFSIENNNGVASQMRLEVPDNNATLGSYTAFQAGNHAGRNYIYTLPIDTPAVGHVLKVISVTPSGSNFFVSLAWDTTQGTAISPVNRAAGTGFAPYVAYWVNDSTIAPADYAYWDAINKRVGLGNFTISNPPQYMLHLRGSSAVGSGDLFIQKDGGTGARLYFGTPNLGNNWTAFRAGNQSVNLDYTLPTVGPTNSGNGTNRFALATDNGNSTSPTLQWTTFWSPSGNAGVSTGFIGTTDANDLRFRTNNTQRMIISATGNVGIATSSPAATLDVNGTASVSGSVSIGGNLTVSGTTITFPSVPSSSTASELMVWNAGSLERRSAAGLVSGIAWSLTGNSSTNPTTNFLGTTDNQPLVIRTNNQERIRVMPNGDIGIGTSTPTQRLHIQNGSIHLQHDENSQSSAALHFRKSRGTESTPTIVQNGDEAGYLHFRGYDGNAYQPAALILSNIDGTPGSNSMPGRLSFLTTPVGSATPVERVRITSAGNVGIGTTTPTTRLHVASSSDPLRLEGVQSDNTLTNVLVIDSDGIVKRRSLTSFPGTTTYIRKTSNQSVTSSTTYQNDNALFYSATANQVFEFEAYMFISGGNGGIKVRVSIPSGASMKLYAELKKDDQHHWVYNKLTSSTDEVLWSDINNSYGYARIVGIIQMGSSGGNVQVQWAQNSSNATATTVESGSYLKITPVQ